MKAMDRIEKKDQMKKGKNQSTDKLKRWKYLDRKTDYVLWF